MTSENIMLKNGNGDKYTLPLPRIEILEKYIPNFVLDHIRENTNLIFSNDKAYGYYVAQPTEAYQITALFMTYNFLTRFFNTEAAKNILKLKFFKDETIKCY